MKVQKQTMEVRRNVSVSASHQLPSSSLLQHVLPELKRRRQRWARPPPSLPSDQTSERTLILPQEFLFEVSCLGPEVWNPPRRLARCRDDGGEQTCVSRPGRWGRQHPPAHWALLSFRLQGCGCKTQLSEWVWPIPRWKGGGDLTSWPSAAWPCWYLSTRPACLGFLLALNPKLSGGHPASLCALLSSQWQKMSSGDLGEVGGEAEEAGEAGSQKAAGVVEAPLGQQLGDNKGKSIL